MTQDELFDNDEQGKIWQWFDNDKEVKFDNDNEAFAHATFPSTASRPIDLIQNPIWQWSAVIRLTTTTDAFLHFEFKCECRQNMALHLANHGQAPPAIIA